ncbi:MAG: hypothetical protein AAF702_43255 [Chloroflexota bacterium]
MPQSIKSFLIITAIIAIWAAPSALLGASYQIALPCTSLGILIAGIMILAISNNEDLWKRITWQDYEESDANDGVMEPLGLVFGCLVGLPISILLLAIASWIVGLILP